MSSGLSADMRAGGGMSFKSTQPDDDYRADDYLRRSKVDKPAIFGVLIDEQTEPKVQHI